MSQPYNANDNVLYNRPDLARSECKQDATREVVLMMSTKIDNVILGAKTSFTANEHGHAACRS